MISLLDSDKHSFGLDNVPKFIKFKAAIENEGDFLVQ